MSTLAGGVVGLVNLRLLEFLLGKAIASPETSQWVALPLMGKFMGLLAAVIAAGFVFDANMIWFAVGFSSIVAGTMVLGLLHVMRNWPTEKGNE